MIRVTLVLHDKRKGEIEVDPTASLKEVKKTIIDELFPNEESSNYLLAVADRTQESPCGTVELQDKDYLFLIPSRDTKPKPVKIIGTFEKVEKHE